MPSHQANLHSFFGGSKPKGEKQASIKGYFAKSKDTDKENGGEQQEAAHLPEGDYLDER